MKTLRDNVLRTRWLQVSEKLKEEGIGALLLTSLADVQWLTGYSGTNGVALALSDAPPLLATDSRYAEQAAVECPEAELIITRDLIEQLLMRLREHSTSQLAVDPVSLSLAEFRRVSAHPALFGVAVQEMDSPIRSLRMVKDLHEMESTAKACSISVEALDSVVKDIKVGTTELHVARMIETAMGEFGSDDRAFPTIVAAGPNGGEPHHAPTEKEIEAGELVTIDFGATINGYHADCTRTFIVGADAAEWQQEIYQAVFEAAERARETAASGVPCGVVDNAARSVIEKAGFAEYFAHGLGHGIGLDVHEAPALNSTTTDTLTKSAPFTIEPGIYLPGKGGVRIEDTCVIGDDGLEVLTEFPRELIRVD